MRTAVCLLSLEVSMEVPVVEDEVVVVAVVVQRAEVRDLLVEEVHLDVLLEQQLRRTSAIDVVNLDTSLLLVAMSS